MTWGDHKNRLTTWRVNVDSLNQYVIDAIGAYRIDKTVSSGAHKNMNEYELSGMVFANEGGSGSAWVLRPFAQALTGATIPAARRV
jgi:hypothetical protein